jgi:diguanylate cyclase (GGDEF)-like protein/PAS domain S-box-containing protein
MSTTNCFPIHPALLRHVIDSANDAFVVCDQNEQILVWSAGAEKMLGWSATEAMQHCLSDLMIPERLRARHREGIKRFLSTGKAKILGRRICVQALHRSSEEITIELKVSPIFLDGSVYFSASIRDSLAAIGDEQSTQYPAMLLDLSDAAMMACDPELKILYWNKGAESLYGYRCDEALGRQCSELLRSSCSVPLSDIRTDLRKTGRWEGQEINYDRSGRRVAVLSKWALEYDTHGEPMRILINSSHLTHTKEYLDNVEFRATHDTLTQLPNRMLLEKRMDQAVATAQKQHGQMAAMFLDLNRFKLVNDTLGHEQGDFVLKVIAQRLVNAVRDGDTVARIGGDEFVICLHQVDDAKAIEEIGERVLKSICQPINLKGQDAVISASIGVAIFPKDGADPATLLKNADMAMYQSKAVGQGSMQFYSEELNIKAIHRFQMESALRNALERNELLMLYQPVVAAQSKEVISVEALIRWRHPVQGLLSPGDFMPIADATDLIAQIDQWVVTTVCAQMKEWYLSGLKPFPVSINISPRQLGRIGFLDDLAQAIETNLFDPKLLEIELTESAVLENLDTVEETLRKIRELGVSLAIDDFGTGYSSLSHLKKLSIDTLKIDGSFIDNMCENMDNQAIVKAAIGMAKSMNMKVVAEGVMTAEQMALLVRGECDALQGFHLSAPVDAVAIKKLMSER